MPPGARPLRPPQPPGGSAHAALGASAAPAPEPYGAYALGDAELCGGCRTGYPHSVIDMRNGPSGKPVSAQTCCLGAAECLVQAAQEQATRGADDRSEKEVNDMGKPGAGAPRPSAPVFQITAQAGGKPVGAVIKVSVRCCCCAPAC